MIGVYRGSPSDTMSSVGSAATMMRGGGPGSSSSSSDSPSTSSSSAGGARAATEVGTVDVNFQGPAQSLAVYQASSPACR